MDNKCVELCPICIDGEALYFTECGHKYCIGCLSRITKCAMCRKPLLRSNLCVDIKRNNSSSSTILGSTYEHLIYNNRLNDNVIRILRGFGGFAYSS
jgi:hypothetical protein